MNNNGVGKNKAVNKGVCEFKGAGQSKGKQSIKLTSLVAKGYLRYLIPL
jgi:hypothetical protein